MVRLRLSQGKETDNEKRKEKKELDRMLSRTECK